MKICLITGSAGLIGAEAVRFFSAKGFKVLGIDNDMRKVFFGDDASTDWSRRDLEEKHPDYAHFSIDIRDRERIESLFREYGSDIEVVVHTAAQPSHDWGAKDPHTDFTVNANGTLTLLEAARKSCPEARFVFLSTNKVYGDNPNRLPLVELDTRYDYADRADAEGIDETMSIEGCLHSLFGASKVAADVLAQEYGRYFGMPVCVLRCGCVTGSAHAGVELHGFLSYLAKCVVRGDRYVVYGHKAKQVRDNIHGHDVATAAQAFIEAPRPGEVYNVGGMRKGSISMLEAIAAFESRTGKWLAREYVEQPRAGDHACYISDMRKFQSHYPAWRVTRDLDSILDELVAHELASQPR
jgi:CDP-paratose 2-epimerase